jgi:hypothetical protein
MYPHEDRLIVFNGFALLIKRSDTAFAQGQVWFGAGYALITD